MTQYSCAVCGGPASSVCSQCKKMPYCSVICQKKDWLSHKNSHKIPNLLIYPDHAKWTPDEIIKSFKEHGYIIIKLLNKENQHLLREIDKARAKLFEYPVETVRKELHLPDTTKDACYIAGSNLQMVDIRPYDKMTKILPDPSVLVPGFKDIFFQCLNFFSEICIKLTELVFEKVPTVKIFGCSIANGGDLSFCRMLNYVKAGELFPPHVDNGFFTVSTKSTSTGLAVKNPLTGEYVYPEMLMTENDLVVIAGQIMEGYTKGIIKATRHAVFVQTPPRQTTLFSIHVGGSVFGMMGTEPDEDEKFEMFMRKYEPKQVDF
ncbi:hypothetical protein O9G_002390 [Rozella allomycis CSF55]|uniref:MYND-type domain-containing protein n=1 Tax=Rozella allomycis (strain CSF55) TaxID=988480 RepID=A0A075AYG0_ROZAC|nr:hypothetical protein O9G_002390 [Rozella allomycis CSF55]|eukprot:EPZ33752.1 hypothetical protein O9G_002390 [Rozella allomycis CSF55]